MELQQIKTNKEAKSMWKTAFDPKKMKRNLNQAI
jgi:hypothetical protein